MIHLFTEWAFLGAQFGPATAVGLFQSVVSCVLIVAGYWAAEKFAGYQVF